MDEELLISRDSNNSPLLSFPIIRAEDVAKILVTKEQKDFNTQLINIIDNLLPYRANYTKHDKSILPLEFRPQDGIWKDRLVTPTNQGKCGSCWSFAASGCLTDRFNILCGQKYLSECLSPVSQIFCNDFFKLLLQDHGSDYQTQVPSTCEGNNLVLAFVYLKLVGISRNSCLPYINNIYNNKLVSTYFGIQQSLDEFGLFSLGNPKSTNLYDYGRKEESISCDVNHPYSEQRPYSYCIDVYKLSSKYFGTPEQNFFSLLNYSIYKGDKDSDNIRYDIYRWGPVATSFLVYDDFYSFNPLRDGVYIYRESPSNQLCGGHAVEIVGWGEYNGISFWWIKNSWGRKYGFDGYFRFLRGVNQCQIEYNVISLLPNLFVDFSNKSEVDHLSHWIMDQSQIFEENDKKNRYATSDILFKILKSEFTFFLDNVFQEIFNTTFQKFPVFGFEMIRQQSGFLQYLNTTRCGYTTQAYLTLPYLDYSCPSFSLPLQSDFFAGSSSPTPPRSSYPQFLLILLCLSLLCLVLLLWTCIYTRSRIRQEIGSSI
jgi:hypothetical protein